jgi:hypothetical protein
MAITDIDTREHELILDVCKHVSTMRQVMLRDLSATDPYWQAMTLSDSRAWALPGGAPFF